MRAVIAVLWSGLWVVGCYSPNPPLGAPCSSSGDCPSGQECDLLTNVCGYPTEMRVLRDDVAADFKGGTHAGTFVESGGFVGPIPYLIEGVRTTGIAGAHLTDSNGAISFDELAMMPATGHGVLRGLDVDYSDDIPQLLGFTEANDNTVLVEGEMFLDQVGTYQFEVRANDIGFFEIAQPGGTFDRIAVGMNMGASGNFTVVTPGWHRYRGAFSNAAQFMLYAVRYRPPMGGIRGVPDDTLRARVDDLAGALVDGCEEAYLVYHKASGLTDDVFGLMFTADPYGLPIGGGTYTLRYTAQLLIDVEGKYTFAVNTSQGQRLWIDGDRVISTFDTAAHDTVTSEIELSRGWHDLVFDAHKTTGPNVRISLGINSAPAGVATGRIPADHLRPVAGRAARFATGSSYSEVDIPDGLTAPRTVSLTLPTGAMPLSVDTGFYITHPLQAQLSMVIDPPVGLNVTLLATGGLTGADEHYQHDTIPTDRAGGSFSFIGGDSLVDTMVGSILSASVSVVYTGGRPPFEPSSSFVSEPREIDALRIGPISWATRQELDGMPVRVSVRTCEDTADCEREAWTEAVNGEPPVVTPRKFFQYKIDITTNENTPTSLDWIELEYVGYIEP